MWLSCNGSLPARHGLSTNALLPRVAARCSTMPYRKGAKEPKRRDGAGLPAPPAGGTPSQGTQRVGRGKAEFEGGVGACSRTGRSQAHGTFSLRGIVNALNDCGRLYRGPWRLSISLPGPPGQPHMGPKARLHVMPGLTRHPVGATGAGMAPLLPGPPVLTFRSPAM